MLDTLSGASSMFSDDDDDDLRALQWANTRAKQRGVGAIDEAKRQALYGYGQAEDMLGSGYEQAAQQLSPYDIGEQALADYQGGVQGWNQFMQPMDYTSHPAYQTMLDEGISAVNQGAAGAGSLYSGKRGLQLRDAGQSAMLGAAQLMGNERNQQMSAYGNYMSGLNNLMGIGQQTSQQLGDLALGQAGAGSQMALQQAGQMGDLARERADYITSLERGGAQSYLNSRAEGRAAADANRMGMMNMGGTMAAGFLSNPAAIAMMSDIALKTNIQPAGERNGHNWYTWDWNDKAADFGLQGRSEGVIAQEVEKVKPEAVTEINGYKAVDYNAL